MKSERLTVNEITVREINSEAGMRDVITLRDRVYVDDQGRLNSVDDTKETFDKYDEYGTYFVAYSDAIPIGAVKIIRDSALGLPCESTAKLTVNLDEYRAKGARLVEFGHLVSAPEVRSQGVGMQLMRHGLLHSITKLRATHILGDFFADASGNFQHFYTHVGFEPICEPYQDVRFAGSPLSVVGMVAIETAFKLWREGSESQRKLLHFFFSDLDRRPAPPPTLSAEAR
ncbi:N-acyl amino acid synthase FeeM domain-containing protein [Sorangium sp. So ce131]|uniref:N-acyl amino acid synthase FeeM domain-containing protein n=1 Tax=Sorangium sp. So ce131 TaxID=3133282 RepID=UPI003F5F9C1B